MTPDETQLLTEMVAQMQATDQALTEHRRFSGALLGVIFGILAQMEGAPTLTEIFALAGDLMPDSTRQANAELLESVRNIAGQLARQS